jgi:hypothetical protein
MIKKDFLIRLHSYVSSDGIIDEWKCREVRGNNTRVRKKFRVRFYNNEKVLIENFTDAIKIAFPELKHIRYSKKRVEVEIRSQRLAKKIIGLGNISTKNWEFPKNMNKKQKIIWIRCFADCEGTIYNKNYRRYISLDSINFTGLKKVSETLSGFEIENKIYTIKYKENISYRLRISGRENLKKYYELVGFDHPKKKEKLIKAINSYKQKL